MNIERYMKQLEAIENSGSMLVCTCCGAETLSSGGIGVCSNCESMVYAARETIAGTNPDLLNHLDAINKSVSEGDFDAAITAYEGMGGKNPALLYAEALLCIRYSNHEISNVNYGRKGFMEENAVNRGKASMLVSKAKRLITKAMSRASNEMESNNGSLDAAYTLFLLQVKLGKLKGASGTLHVLGGMGNAYLSGYAGVVFSASLNRHDEVLKGVDAMMDANQLPLNALYYAAFALFKKGMLKESTAVLERLQHLMGSTSAESLLDEIRKLQDA